MNREWAVAGTHRVRTTFVTSVFHQFGMVNASPTGMGGYLVVLLCVCSGLKTS